MRGANPLKAFLLSLVLVGTAAVSALAAPSSWGDAGAEPDGAYQAEVGTNQPSAKPVSNTGATQAFWASWRTVDSSVEPPCLREVGARFEVESAEEARRIAAQRSRVTDRWVEDRLVYDSAFVPRCDAPDVAAAGVDGGELTDLVEGLLPRPTLTISGGRAITGNRSWLDLGRPASHDHADSFDLGALGTRDIVITGTATTTIDWGDGTVSSHAGTGGPYRPGQPGPEDITHTYVDTGPRVVTVVDTWRLTFDIEGLPPIDVEATLEPVTLPVEVSEVRSVRQE